MEALKLASVLKLPKALHIMQRSLHRSAMGTSDSTVLMYVCHSASRGYEKKWSRKSIYDDKPQSQMHNACTCIASLYFFASS